MGKIELLRTKLEDVLNYDLKSNPEVKKGRFPEIVFIHSPPAFFLF